MKKMFSHTAVAVIAAASLLSACQTTEGIDVRIRQSLPQICAGAETAYAIVAPFIAADKLKPKTVAAVEAAHANLVTYCAAKETANLASTLVAASIAAVTISLAVQEARRVQ